MSLVSTKVDAEVVDNEYRKRRRGEETESKWYTWDTRGSMPRQKRWSSSAATSRAIDRTNSVCPLAFYAVTSKRILLLSTHIYIHSYLCVCVPIRNLVEKVPPVVESRGIRNLPFITANIRSTSLRVYLGSWIWTRPTSMKDARVLFSCCCLWKCNWNSTFR